ncbi:MAG: S8 family serine peptidase, partial [Proteobacteria bacterium]|nr:S8 family serine peptidase [Pseudomonadota bacterium]
GGGGGGAASSGGGVIGAGWCDNRDCTRPTPIDNFTTSDASTTNITNPIFENFNATLNMSNMGNRTAGYNMTNYIVPEYNFTLTGVMTNNQSVLPSSLGLAGSDHLQAHKFASAYERGWTGKNVTVAIADSGIDVGHPEFWNSTTNATNVKAMINFVNQTQTMSANSSHGTATAGAIAARRDGIGLHGGAFDADLLIAKIVNGRPNAGADNISIKNIIRAMEWAGNQSADVINLSLAIQNPPSIFDLQPVPNANGGVVAGEWYSNHEGFGKRGLDDAVGRAVLAKQAIGDDMVMVLAAGNNGLVAQSFGLAQMATATDRAGNLILDGQVIIAGYWNSKDNRVEGNKAGNVCNYWNATANNGRGRCMDAAKIKDFYLLADGIQVSTWDRADIKGFGSGYAIGRGSSLSAPLVSAGAAIIKQMWPHLKANQLVQILLRSGNRTFAGYMSHVHGQGIMDMDAATRPLGNQGIPTANTINTTADLLAIRGSVRLTHPLSAEAEAGLRGIMLLDEFHRNFPLDLNALVSTPPTNSLAGAGGSWLAGSAGFAGESGLAAGGSDMLVDYFAEYLAADQRVLLPAVPLTANSAVRVGFGASDGHVLGNAFHGILGTTRSSHTLYGLYRYGAGVGGGYDGSDGGGDDAGAGKGDAGFYAQLGLGVSYTEFDRTGSLLTDAEPMLSSTATVGYGFDVAEVFGRAGRGAGAGGEAEAGAGGGDWGQVQVSATQPLRFERARLEYDIPVGRSLGGEVARETRVVDFAPDGREVDVGVAYGVALSEGVRFMGFAGRRVVVGADAGEGASRFGMRVVGEF